jgi:hypothetical protein
VAEPEIVGAVFVGEGAGAGDGVGDGVAAGGEVCVDVEASDPPPHAVSEAQRITEQQAKRIREPAKVLIVCDPIK